MGPGYKNIVGALIVTVMLSACASGDLSDGFSYDYQSAQITDFNGSWEGRVDCKYDNGFKPLAWVRISDGRGEFGFGKASAGFGHATLGSIYDDFDASNGSISWRGNIVPWQTGEKMPVSFKGQWMQDKFRVAGRIARSNCSGVLVSARF